MKHFKESEFMMDEENVFNEMNTEFLCLLDDLRELVGEPLKVNSSYRSVAKNQAVGGSSKSQHLLGNAVDLSCNNGVLRLKIVQNALELGLSVGVNKYFIHVDNRLKQIVFAY